MIVVRAVTLTMAMPAMIFMKVVTEVTLTTVVASEVVVTAVTVVVTEAVTLMTTVSLQYQW